MPLKVYCMNIMATIMLLYVSMTESNPFSLQSYLPGVCAYLICQPCIAAMVESGSAFLQEASSSAHLPYQCSGLTEINEGLSHSANVGLNKPLSSIFNHSTSSSLQPLATVTKISSLAQVQSSTNINFSQSAARFKMLENKNRPHTQ